MKKFFPILFVLSLAIMPTVRAQESLDIQTSVLKQNVPRNGVGIPFLVLRLTAKIDTWVSEIHVKQGGLSVPSDVKKVYAQISGISSYKLSINNDSRAKIKFKTPVLLPANKIMEARILADLNAKKGHTIGFKVEKIVTTDKAGTKKKDSIYPLKTAPTKEQERSTLLKKTMFKKE